MERSKRYYCKNNLKTKMTYLDDLTNISIEKFLFPKSRFFLGVFSCNKIPQNIVQKESYIFVCNLSKEKEKGTHFITIVSHKNEILYVDSFGLPCTNLDIRLFLYKSKRKIFFNTKTIQHPLSNLCGYFCILFVLYFEREIQNEKNIKMFFYPSNKLMKNDKLCLKYINKLKTSD